MNWQGNGYGYNEYGYNGYGDNGNMVNQQMSQVNQIELNTDLLLRLGFDTNMVYQLSYMVQQMGKITVQKLCNMGIDYVTAKDYKYMYDLGTGYITLESEQDLIKHLKRVNGRHKKIGIADLTVSRVTSVPRVAVVSGIRDEPFTIYNSKQYSFKEMLYKVEDVSRSRITVLTSRKPRIKWGDPKKVDGVVEILELQSDGKVLVAFDKSICRLCNRYIIVASMKRPEFHLGMVEILCYEGSKVYVYAQILKPTEIIRYNNGTQRVYSYGFEGRSINSSVIKVANEIYQKLRGVTSKTFAGNQEFRLLPEEEVMREEREAEIEFDD